MRTKQKSEKQKFANEGKEFEQQNKKIKKLRISFRRRYKVEEKNKIKKNLILLIIFAWSRC